MSGCGAVGADNIAWCVNDAGRMEGCGVIIDRFAADLDRDCCGNCIHCSDADSVAPGEDWVLDMERSVGTIYEESAICPRHDGVIVDRWDHKCRHHERDDRP